jgi:anti-anti-sigma factor
MVAVDDFNVSTDRLSGRLVVAPSGEIDLATVGLLRDAVEGALRADDELVLDLRGVTFMDTSGLRYLLELNARSDASEFTLRLVRGPGAVQRVFEVSGIESRLPFVDDLPE